MPYVEPLSDARTQLADFVNSLLAVASIRIAIVKIMMLWIVFLLLTVLSGCAHHDLDTLRASAPDLMQEVVGPYDGLSKCTKERFDQHRSANLTLSENPDRGINRLAMLKTRQGFLARRGQDALFEFTFVRQSARSTLVEFRTVGSTDQSDPAWQAIAECSTSMRIEPAPSPLPTAGVS